MLSILLNQLPPDKWGLYISPYGLQYKYDDDKKKKLGICPVNNVNYCKLQRLFPLTLDRNERYTRSHSDGEVPRLE